MITSLVVMTVFAVVDRPPLPPPTLWAEVQTTHGVYSPRVWLEMPVTSRMGVFAFAENEHKYREGFAGVNLKVGNDLTLGGAFGRESPGLARRVFYAEYAKGLVYGWAWIEDGQSGSWHTIHETVDVSRHWAFGLMHETDKGLGPRVELKFGGGRKATLWSSTLHTQGRWTQTVGINYSF